MVNLGIAGNKFDIDFDEVDSLGLSLGAQTAFLLFTGFYYFCMVLIVVVLLRLFMAMLSATFAGVNQAALLTWRLQFARHVLHHELIAMRMGNPFTCTLRRPRVPPTFQPSSPAPVRPPFACNVHRCRREDRRELVLRIPSLLGHRWRQV